MILQGHRYFTSFWNVFDFITILGSLILELILGRIYGAAVSILIMLRFWRIFRVVLNTYIFFIFIFFESLPNE
ncbi:hypothetical protein HMI56_005670 [Coelomomyces lativittatus]|nr:hypothetical protein HMI56_005670 [Coelomomyces lativittatus]